MRHFFFIFIILLFSCEEEIPESCGCESGNVIQKIPNAKGIIKEEFNSHFIVPESGGRLAVCDGLANEFEKDGFEVTYSGLIIRPCPNAKYSGTLFKLTDISPR